MSNLPPESHDHVKTDAEVIDDLVLKARTFFEEHGNRIILYIGCAVLLIGGLVFYFNTENSTSAAAWQRFESATSPEELAGVAQDFSGDIVAVWAKLREAEQRAAQGGRLMMVDRENALLELQLSQEAFDEVLSNPEAPDEARERALFGLARVAESLNAEDLSVAVSAYDKLLTQFPETPYKDIADNQIAYLKSDQAKSFYGWFAQQKPVPAEIAEPQEGMTTSEGSTPTLDLGLDDPADPQEPGDGPMLTDPAGTEQSPAETPDESQPETEKAAAETSETNKPEPANPESETSNPETSNAPAETTESSETQSQSPTPEPTTDQE